MTLGWATLMAFVAGLASSVGPCVAPRFVAIASLAAGEFGTRRWSRVGAFVAGLCSSYVLLSSVAGAIVQLSAYSGYLYAIFGACLIGAGIATIVRTQPCAPCRRKHTTTTYGATFLAGTAFATIGSPCCGPLAAVAGIGIAQWPASSSAVVAGAFAVGHAMPLIAVALGSARLEARFRSPWATTAVATVAGALSIALGSYYALLA